MSSTRLPRKKSKQRPTGFFRQVKNSKKKKIKVFAVLTHIYTHTLIRQGSVKHSFTTRFSFSSLLLNPLSLLVRMSREREREKPNDQRERKTKVHSFIELEEESKTAAVQIQCNR